MSDDSSIERRIRKRFANLDIDGVPSARERREAASPEAARQQQASQRIEPDQPGMPPSDEREFPIPPDFPEEMGPWAGASMSAESALGVGVAAVGLGVVAGVFMKALLKR